MFTKLIAQGFCSGTSMQSCNVCGVLVPANYDLRFTMAENIYVTSFCITIRLWLCHSLVRSEHYAAGRHPELVSGSLGVHGNILPGDAEINSA